jgi:glycosidase
MSAPDWMADAVFYQIFPDRFANGDPGNDPPGVEPWGSEPTRDDFMGGDIQGIIDHLDHISDLGANALYLTPVFEAGTNHRYDATDYFAIDHRLGDSDDFQRLVAEAHGRGIRVVLDGVFNHCGSQHPFFQDVVARGEESEYVDWFSIQEFPIVSDPRRPPNYLTCSGCWYLPKWNAFNPAVRAHHLAVARHWIDRGIDGWRLDVPYFVNKRFWREFRRAVKDRGEDLVLVAEEWGNPEEWLQGDIADGTMNYTARDVILGFTADRSLEASEAAARLKGLQARIPAGYHHGMLNLLGSHDTERVLTRHHGDVEAEKCAYTLMYALEGAPMIYYGDEVGMRGENDPGCRGAMPWDEGEWEAGLLGHIRGLGRLRSGLPALRRGTQSVRALDPDTLLVARRHPDGPAVVVVHRGAGVTVDPRALGAGPHGDRWIDHLGHRRMRGSFTIEGPGSLILTPDGGNGQ